MNCGRLKPKIEIFEPLKVFEFVFSMFSDQCRLQGTQLIFKHLNHAFMDLPIRDLRLLMVPNDGIKEIFPPYLRGD